MGNMIMKIRVLSAKTLIIGAVLAVANVSIFSQKIETGFLNRSVVVNGSEFRYVVYVPRVFTRSEKIHRRIAFRK